MTCKSNFCVDFGYHLTKNNKKFKAEFDGSVTDLYYNSWNHLYTIKDNTFYTINENEHLVKPKSLVQTSSEIFQIKKFAYHRPFLCLLSKNGEFLLLKTNDSENQNDLILENSVIKKVAVKDFSILESMSKISIVNENGTIEDFNLKVDDICLQRRISTQISIKSVCRGMDHTILLSNKGLVYSFGCGSRGQLGHGDLESVSEPKLLEYLAMIRIESISCGSWHNAVLSESRDVYVWGWNKHGQCGLPSNEDDPEQVGTVTEPTLLQLEPHCSEQLQLEANEFVEISQVSCGARHCAAVTTSGYMISWGWGKYGQLGYEVVGGEECRLPRVVGGVGEVCGVDCGWWSTFVVCEK